MSEFVEVHISSIFHTFRADIEKLRDEIIESAAPTLRREEEASIRERFYRTGAGLRSLKDEVVTEGQKKIYKLFPTAFYMIFGEYGTGRRGARTGRPAPRGWKYGQHEKGSMEARRFSRLAVIKAKPEVNRHAQRKVDAFVKNMTVN